MEPIHIFWFRRDLRLNDNAGLFQALKSGKPVLPLFIFDRYILDKLEDKDDPRVNFIHGLISGIHEDLSEQKSSMIVKYGFPEEVWKEILEEYPVAAVYTNRDYEPYAKERDQKVRSILDSKGIEMLDFKDHVIFDRDEVVKGDGDPYTVFTPYSRTWRGVLEEETTEFTNDSGEKEETYKALAPFPSEQHLDALVQTEALPMISLEEMGFRESDLEIPSTEVNRGLIKSYDKTRNFPAINGTSRLGIHFRFGSISIRNKARKALKLNKTYLNELVWRDFYSMILNHFPKVVEGPFREKYKFIEWRNNESEFEAWCEGRTGYPIVDAGMRELNNTGYMHNRVRMITASFLTKHLLIDWRWGEAYFARKLLDFDLASNNGGWQWAAGTGTDAAPYFRIFNPYSQQKKFDKDFKYIREWIPEFETKNYPEPIVDHKEARERCLEAYKSGLNEAAKVL